MIKSINQYKLGLNKVLIAILIYQVKNSSLRLSMINQLKLLHFVKMISNIQTSPKGLAIVFVIIAL